MQNLSFRGTNDKLYSAGNGNFEKFVEYLALFDHIMNEHLHRVKVQETLVQYLGKDIQNELIQLLAGAIKKKIITSTTSAKYYSIILDCTPDVSHIEQMTMIVRFVDVSKPSDNESESITIREHFLGFIPLQETTGAFIAETLLEQLKLIQLPIENLRGQGYDNGSNMKGKQNGAQKRILDLNPRAFFVPCNAHSLNLVVNDAARCCLEATTFFGLVQQIYNYFSTSTKRWQVLISHISDLGITVKPLSETRWESRIDTLKPLRYHLGNIYDALIEIFEDTSLSGPSGNTSQVEAKGLADAVSKFKFVVSLVTWYNILFEVNLTSKLLQNKEADLNSATRQLQVTKNYLITCRCDKGFQQVLTDATEIANEIQIVPNFETEDQVRNRRKKWQFDYEAREEAPQDPKQKFKTGFYYAVLDMAIQSIEERFQQLQKYNSLFGFLYDIYSIKKKSTEDLLKDCNNLEKSLMHNGNKDIDAEDLRCELEAIARKLLKPIPPQEVLLFILQNKLLDNVPNVSVALRILLTLQVSVASGERSFSKLKLIKSYIRSTMLEKRLVGLATISIEHTQAAALDLAEMVTKFAKEKARRVRF
ncbi:zinc finger MYM-type protein 1-like [Bombina bombina]|uniref:zinc finger MYM-type protein 1-like n=1 Tax=Bombina bombina TaxID=8345 RepID=UPI00235AD519|nr:zinc finger MYM-type protein 1-like [Bombina bombina]